MGAGSLVVSSPGAAGSLAANAAIASDSGVPNGATYSAR